MKLVHVSSLSPEEMNGGFIAPHWNTAIDGKKYFGIWCNEASQPVSNAYLGRGGSGMFKLDDIVVYGDENVYEQDGKLLLHEPMYAYYYEVDNPTLVQRGEAKEYIVEDKYIDIDLCDVEQIKDVSKLVEDYQVFTRTNGQNNLMQKLPEIYLQGGYSAVVDMLEDAISRGDLTYLNDEVKVNSKLFNSPEIKRDYYSR